MTNIIFPLQALSHCAPEEISLLNLNVSWLGQKTQARVNQQVLLPHSHENNALCLSVASHRIIIKALLDVAGRIKHTETPGTDKSSKKHTSGSNAWVSSVIRWMSVSPYVETISLSYIQIQ